MKKSKLILAILALVMALSVMTVPVFASVTNSNTKAEAETTEAADESADEDTAAASSTGSKAMAAGVAIGLAALGGAIAMGMAVAKSNEGISRQPEASGDIRTTLMLGLVFIETVVIYALIVTILIVFVM